MLQNWLKPLSKDVLKLVGQLGASSLGKNALLHADAFPELKHTRVALIGLDEKEADKIREHLYKYQFPFPAKMVADLGNLRKPNEASLLIPVVFELLQGKVVPILLGGNDAMAKAQFLAYQETKNLVNLVAVDESLQLEPGSSPLSPYLDLLLPRHAAMFHFALLGYQSHQMSAQVLELLDKHHDEAIRLGRSRASIEETEPTIRDADLMAFHLSALKQCEAPGVISASPSGYFLEEACQLCWYAGMSDKLSSFGVYGFQNALDQHAHTAQGAAQLAWYFLDGFFNRKNDYPVSKDGLTEYIVDFRQLNYQLTFWKSARSARWWMQIPVDSGKRKYQRHRLVPCSHQDYQMACRDELPDRLMHALKRFA